MASRRGHPSVVRLVLVLLGACLIPLAVRGAVVPATTGTQLEAAGTAAERAALRADEQPADQPDGGVATAGRGQGEARPAGGSTADIPPAPSSSSTSAPTTTTPGDTTEAPRPTTTERPTETPAPPPSTTAAPTLEELQVARVLELVNEVRAGVPGCRPLEIHPQLARAAQLHSEDMSARGYMDHVTPEGLDPGDRAAAQGYTDPVGENIAMGYPSADEVMEGWMASDGHRRNIENCRYTVIGIGVDPDGWYWTQLFGI